MVNLLIPEEEEEEEEEEREALLVCLCTLYLLACQVRVTVGDSGASCCACVVSFERQLTPLCVDSINFCPCRVRHMFLLLLWRSPSRTFLGSPGMCDSTLTLNAFLRVRGWPFLLFKIQDFYYLIREIKCVAEH